MATDIVAQGLSATTRKALMGEWVTSYGAKCDLVPLQFPAMTSGSAVLTATDGAFTSADVGKTMCVSGAGAAGVPLITTIASVQSATQCTLAAAASTTVSSSVGSVTWYAGASTNWGAKAYYGTDDTAAIQAAINDQHPKGGIVYIPAPGCMVLSTLYVQTSSVTNSTGLIWKRLLIQGCAPSIQSNLVGAASATDSNLFRPSDGDIIRVNLDSSGNAVADTSHQFYNFGIQNISLNGPNGGNVQGMSLYNTRAYVLFCTFNNLSCGWDAYSPDASGRVNYCDQWYVQVPRFNACKALFKQANGDACIFDQIRAESFHPAVTTAIYYYGARGWEIRTPLINSLPATAVIGDFEQTQNGEVVGGHFEQIAGTAFTINGSNSNTSVDITRCNFYNSLSATTAMTLDSIKYYGAGGKVEGCNFSQTRSSGYDINFAAGRWQEESRNQFFAADNSTRRTPSVYIASGAGVGATAFHQKYFVNVIYTGTVFDIRNVNGVSVLSQIFSGPPVMSGNKLNLDGPALWGKPNKAVVMQKAGKYLPVLTDVNLLGVQFYNSSGTLITTPDTNMDFWLEVE